MGATVFERQAPDPAMVQAALADSRLTPFWLDDVDRPSYPRLDTDAAADLVIVGGGYSGLWTAVLAKERNPHRSVILLEARRVGWAASGRNGGFGSDPGRCRTYISACAFASTIAASQPAIPRTAVPRRPRFGRTINDGVVCRPPWLRW